MAQRQHESRLHAERERFRISALRKSAMSKLPFLTNVPT